MVRTVSPDILAIQEDTPDEQALASLGRHSDALASTLTGFTVLHADSSLAWVVGPRVTIEQWREAGGFSSDHRRPLLLRVTFSGSPITLCNVHLPLNHSDRQVVVRELLRESAHPAADIVCGDFNERQGVGVLADLAASGLASGAGSSEPTMPAEAPAIRIDHILVNVAARLETGNARLIGRTPDENGYYASDHLGVVGHIRRTQLR